jgi:calpain-7
MDDNWVDTRTSLATAVCLHVLLNHRLLLTLSSDATEPDKLWRRIVKAFNFGDVLITLGTGKISPRVERELGLVGEHDYAVLALDEQGEHRQFLIKNPWLRGVDRKSIEPIRSAPFWLDLQHVVQNFENIYLSWNPGLFTHRQDIHFAWDLQGGGGRSAAGAFTMNPQYSFSCAFAGPAWILLSKHFTSREKKLPKSRRAEFISIYLFMSDGRRVNFSRGAIEQSPYVDSPQALLKVDAKVETKYTIVVSEQELQPMKHGFSLSVFAASKISLDAAQPRFVYSTVYDSSWTRDTAGGRADLPTFSQNPQFKLELKTRSQVCLVLETAVTNLRVHVTLLLSQDQRVYTVSTRDVVADSGMYRLGCAIAETREAIPAGKYTIVCSTYESDALGKFTLRLDANIEAILKPIPREGGGRLRTRLQDAIFQDEVAILAAPILLQRICRASFTAQYISYMPADRSRPTAQSPLRLSVELGRGPDRHILLERTIGFDGDTGNMLRTKEIDLRPDMARSAPLYLVLERNDGYEGVANADEVVNVEMWLDLQDGLSLGSWTSR